MAKFDAVHYAVKQKKYLSSVKETNMTTSLSGTIDRKAGIIKLAGEATIPPMEKSQPIPIKIQAFLPDRYVCPLSG